MSNDADIDNLDNSSNFSLDSIDSVTVNGLTIDPTLPDSVVSIASNQVRFNPGNAFDELDSGDQAVVTIGYTMSDVGGLSSSSQLVLTIVGLNDSPVAIDDTGSTAEHLDVSIDVLSNDTDVDLDDIPDTFRLDLATVVSSSGLSVSPMPAGSVSISAGQLVFSPGSDFYELKNGESATVTISYTMSDDAGLNSTAELLVTIIGADAVDSNLLAVNGAATNLNRSGVGELSFGFEQAVLAVGTDAFAIRNHSTDELIDLSLSQLTGNGTSELTLDLLPIEALLDDGRYTVELIGEKFSPQVASRAFEFLKRAGDLNGDGRVSSADFGLVSAFYDPLLGNPFRMGDANGDGRVTSADFGVVGSNFDPLLLESVPQDFGDAPASYPVALADDGARHVVSDTYLGSSVDSEANGVASSNSNSDGADDDGIMWNALAIGDNAIEALVAANDEAFLNIWIDLNQDGDWDDANEHLIRDLSVHAGNNNIVLNLPSEAGAGTTYARVRLSGTRGYGVRGLAPDGEVEDYQVEIASENQPAFSQIDLYFAELEDAMKKRRSRLQLQERSTYELQKNNRQEYPS